MSSSSSPCCDLYGNLVRRTCESFPRHALSSVASDQLLHGAPWRVQWRSPALCCARRAFLGGCDPSLRAQILLPVCWALCLRVCLARRVSGSSFAAWGLAPDFSDATNANSGLPSAGRGGNYIPLSIGTKTFETRRTGGRGGAGNGTFPDQGYQRSSAVMFLKFCNPWR